MLSILDVARWNGVAKVRDAWSNGLTVFINANIPLPLIAIDMILGVSMQEYRGHSLVTGENAGC